MKPLIVDKIASVTERCALEREVRVSSTFPCREGDVVAVRVQSRKTRYNQLELATGRFCELKPGDVVVGALGHRAALLGYAGRLPESLEVGSTVHLLNLGGVIGLCDSWHPDVGEPCACEVLGQVLAFPHVGERMARPANIGDVALPRSEGLAVDGIPVVAVIGTSMNAGKTFACASIIQELTRRRFRVAAAKATGVSLRRDVHAMTDAGASPTLIFTDFGTVTTTAASAPGLTRALLSRLATSRPDVIVLELGDGLLGHYGVDAILASDDIRAAFSATVVAAADPVAAWGAVELLRERYDMTPTCLTGPVTDNAAGAKLVTKVTGFPARNARLEPIELADVVVAELERRGLLEPHPRS